MKFDRKAMAKARRKAGHTQKSVAARLGVTPQTIANWETGRNTPTLTWINRLAKAVAVRAEALLCKGGA